MEGDSMVILYILYLVLFVVTAIFGIVCVKIKLAGMNVKDFFDFILAINDLDSLYVYSKSNRKMTKNEQTMFLKEAETVFSILEKIPSMLSKICLCGTVLLDLNFIPLKLFRLIALLWSKVFKSSLYLSHALAVVGNPSCANIQELTVTNVNHAFFDFFIIPLTFLTMKINQLRIP